MEYLETVRDRKVWQPVPQTVRERFDGPVPREGEGAEAAYRDFVRDVLPYPVGNIHPRFWGWVQGTGTPLGMTLPRWNITARVFGFSALVLALTITTDNWAHSL